MKKLLQVFMVALALVMVISACSGNDGGNNNEPINPGQTETPGNVEEPGDNDLLPDGTDELPDTEEPADSEEPVETEEPGKDDGEKTEVDLIVELIMEAIEERSTMELTADMLQDWYHLDADLLAEFSIHPPMFNISSSEFAVVKVNDVQDVPVVEEAMKKRAEDVQKTFAEYLPDQYEYAKNYKIITKDAYILFVIDEETTAEKIIQTFENYFKNE